MFRLLNQQEINHSTNKETDQPKSRFFPDPPGPEPLIDLPQSI